MRKTIRHMMVIVATALTAISCMTGERGKWDEANGRDYGEGFANGEIPRQPEDGNQFSEFADNPFVATKEAPSSTFSIDADGAAYCIMRNYLKRGYAVPKHSVRIEEYLNYFTFDYTEPTDGQRIAINGELGRCPWDEEHLLLRLGVKGRSLSAEEVPLSNYVFLIDVSGSMNCEEKIHLLKSGLLTLLTQLRPDDRISIITYSGEVKKLLESTTVSEADVIAKAIKKLSASGCTAGGEALKMAYEEALANYDPARNNRIIMGTDGDFNVGVTSTEALTEMVERYAKHGIYMTCLGFGMGNLNDAMMESISNKGNGTYHYIDSEDEMMKVFVHERERFVAVANDTKCQVTFNPDVIDSYRLIGYENRVMSNKDFEDDRKDAGEIGAGQTITALYELIPTAHAMPHGGATVTAATFDCRYKKSLDGESIPLTTTLSLTHDTASQASENLRFAAGVAAWGMVLRESAYKGTADITMARTLVTSALGFDPHGYRSELLQLMEEGEAVLRK